MFQSSESSSRSLVCHRCLVTLTAAIQVNGNAITIDTYIKLLYFACALLINRLDCIIVAASRASTWSQFILCKNMYTYVANIHKWCFDLSTCDYAYVRNGFYSSNSTLLWIQAKLPLCYALEHHIRLLQIACILCSFFRCKIEQNERRINTSMPTTTTKYISQRCMQMRKNYVRTMAIFFFCSTAAVVAAAIVVVGGDVFSRTHFFAFALPLSRSLSLSLRFFVQ